MRSPWALLTVLCLPALNLNAQQADLTEAAKAGDTAKVRQLLKKGTAVNTRDANGRTALHEAAATENADLFKLLITAGADIYAKDNNGITPDYIARHIRSSDISTAMLRAILQRTMMPPGDGPWTLTAAIAHRQINVVQMLLQMHADANAVDVNGDYPLDLAAQKGDAQIAQLLLSHGADINLRNKAGAAPIHTAALNGSTEIVALLLDHHAEINSKVSPTGETPLYYAAAFGRTNTVELLLKRGADPTIANSQGMTPLSAALKADQADAANLLRRTPTKSHP